MSIPLISISSFFKQAKRIRSRKKIAISKQFIEYVRLRKKIGKIGPQEYFEYKLYTTNMTFADKTKFVGWAGENVINNHFNSAAWSAVTLDKLFFYTILQGARIPFPSVRAVYSSDGLRTFPDTPILRSDCDLVVWIENELGDDGLFVKPNNGNYGRNTFLLSGYDRDRRLIKTSETVLKVNEFTAKLERSNSAAYIFQEYIRPHAEITHLTDHKTATIRISMMSSEGRYYPLSAVWKLPVGNNHIDNFHHGTTGNLVASVDVDSGVVNNLVGIAANGKMENMQLHPENGHQITGVTLPMWRDVIELCVETGKVIPGLRLLHFDVALSIHGPQMIEVNRGGNMDIHQVASGKGFLTDGLSGCLRR